MTSKYTLDDIRAAADAKYANTVIALEDGDVVLVNPLQLSKEKRKALEAAQTKIDEGEDETEDETGADTEAKLENALRVVSKTPAQAERLIEALGGNLAQLAAVFELYTEGTSAGEASASAA